MTARIIISGASGLVGRALERSLAHDGVRDERLVSGEPASPLEHAWAPGERALDPGVFEGARAVVNLNGASIGRLPWTRGYRRTLVRSRIDSTRTIADALGQLGAQAPQLVSASAVGYYG